MLETRRGCWLPRLHSSILTAFLFAGGIQGDRASADDPEGDASSLLQVTFGAAHQASSWLNNMYRSERKASVEASRNRVMRDAMSSWVASMTERSGDTADAVVEYYQRVERERPLCGRAFAQGERSCHAGEVFEPMARCNSGRCVGDTCVCATDIRSEGCCAARQSCGEGLLGGTYAGGVELALAALEICGAESVFHAGHFCQGKVCDQEKDKSSCCSTRETCGAGAGALRLNATSLCAAHKVFVDDRLCQGVHCEAEKDTEACCRERETCGAGAGSLRLDAYTLCNNDKQVFVHTRLCRHEKCSAPADGDPGDRDNCCVDRPGMAAAVAAAAAPLSASPLPTYAASRGGRLLTRVS
eukprot:gnl/TRDRNA2_/TRDRNA2_182708_c0_seq1.p1 gnl/TRDRNA2_/TRDRNA2_182708_c0~~gnl/TRDRNA2_/TRDRNA2_182708_c0_seq1.p1  ORF type:complete len:357 (-),score=48.38 gnl/TRDRNA2_/TRDRNA2_182708_c0_seq1:32-1102(-)